ncbi:MAG: DNA methyltransferase, partial [Candidatus Nanohaloarchaea archaeon]
MSELKDTVSEYEKIHVDGEFSRNRTIEQANKSDEELIGLLLSNERLKDHFFTEAGDNYVFDKEKFVEFVNNKQFLEDSYTQFKNKVGLKTGDEYYREKKDVELAWPYKDCVLQGGQTKEDEDRKEKFWNTTLAPDQVDKLLDPKVLTNFKRYTEDGEKEVEEISEDDNLFIRGNNLLALHSLKKRYRDSIDMVYIDPPYNTDSDDFEYNDSFNHSTWLTFMKNRLEITRELMSNDAVIFVQIDDNELHYLNTLMDEVFGRENHLITITVKRSSAAGHKTINPTPVNVTDYILMYAKDKEEFEYNTQYTEAEYDEMYNKIVVNKDQAEPQNWEVKDFDEYVAEQLGFSSADEAREQMKGGFKEEMADYALENANKVFQRTAINYDSVGKTTQEAYDRSKDEPDRIFEVEREGHENIYVKDKRKLTFYKNRVEKVEGQKTHAKVLTNFWDDISWNGISSEGRVTLNKGKKPERLLRRLIKMSTDKEDRVMDFFLGSGTTAAVAHKMGRKYIGVEQLEYGESDPVVRLNNVLDGESTGVSPVENWNGGGDFVYAELMGLNSQFLEKIEDADSQEEV